MLEYPGPEPDFAGPLALAAGIEWIRLPLSFPPRHVNIYRIEISGGMMLVDTGLGDRETRELWDSLWPRAACTEVVVTHFHPDHIGQAATLEGFGARISVPAPEIAKARQIHALEAGELMVHMSRFFVAHGLRGSAPGFGRGNGYRHLVSALPEHSIPLLKGALAFAPEWSVRFAGGHSPAHALLTRDHTPIIVAGDILLPRITPNISVWPEDPDADPLGDYLRALNGLRRDLPAEMLVLPAHGRPYRGVQERIAAIQAHHAGRLNVLREAIGKAGAVSAAEMLLQLFPHELDPGSLPFALGETVAHLNHLWRRGEIERPRDRHGIYRYMR